MLKKINILITFLLVSQSILAQETSFKASVSKDRLGVNERLRITFTINKQGGDNFTPPDFKDFKVLAGPMQATSFSDFNGKKSFEMAYSYTLQPKRKGIITIPSASVELDGNVIKSNTVKITVTNAVEIPKDPNDPKYIASQNIHLVAEVSNSNPYVGESISVVYKIYVDVNKVSVRSYRETESPSFNGFWNQNIEINQSDSKESTFQGRTHRYQILRKVVLIPQKSGKLKISPLEMEIGAGIPIGRRDLFGNMITRNFSFVTSTGERTINVKPLPSENKPIDFAGAVGNFDFKVTTSKNELKANEAAQIKVEVSGKGNLKMVELPKIETPAGLEKYEPEHKENIRTSLGGFTGSVYDQYTVVPQFRGKYKIPPTTFSYFSLNDKTYKTITSDAIIINAPEGKIAADENSVVTTKRDVITNAKDIRFISVNADLKPNINSDDFFKSKLFYLLLILPLLSIPFGIFIGMKKQQRDSDVIGNKRRKADRLAKKYLSEAKKQLGHKENFYEALEKALHNYLKAKLQVETTDISKEKIRELLQQRKVDNETINSFIKVFDSCDYARYTPTTNVMMKQEYEAARKVIVKIDKQL
ncbi:BatD family protein [Aureibaculum sp. 2210JD6-5]|uniref:BatD family protein n=1 Tax=Aureibaculum sp. 2210JD6-5 TaxID=3103957 RepID=UPI002AADBF69|nr:BatD family protein [Aureibaculum sp. 2210JD6-5]MDY7395952.1 BatD family protein [Aureibaculum sp. 2210JD6-5]